MNIMVVQQLTEVSQKRKICLDTSTRQMSLKWSIRGGLQCALNISWDKNFFWICGTLIGFLDGFGKQFLDYLNTFSMLHNVGK